MADSIASPAAWLPFQYSSSPAPAPAAPSVHYRSSPSPAQTSGTSDNLDMADSIASPPAWLPFQYSSSPAPAPAAPPVHDRSSPSPAPAAPPVHSRSVPAIAIGYAVGAAVVLLAIISCLVVALRRRRARRRSRSDLAIIAMQSAGSSHKLPSSIDDHPSQSVAALQAPQSVHVSPPPSSSSMSAASSSLAASRNICTGDALCSQPQADTADTRQSPPEILLFQGAIPYEELAAATNGFADSNLVGRGGFGDVYAGTIDGGAAVAVKRLRQGSQQGDREFQAEVRIIARVHHRNLVSLVGYCVDDAGRRLLVYEYVPNMTLEYHLHGGAQSVLDWPTRWKIAVGAAKGLAYLHEDCHPRIIHRDIKAANILLDSDFNPKVSDFGMAKFIPGRETHVSTRIVGTIGYLAPEYAISGRITEKSDVFSFGVVLLELITGMSAAISSHPDTDDTLVGWARPLLRWALEHSSFDDLVDPLLRSFDADRMARLVRCAAAAVRSSARRRPRMSQIVRHLEGDASAEEIDACGAGSVGETETRRSADDGDTKQVPVRYNDIRTSRRQANRRTHNAAASASPGHTPLLN